MSSLPSRFVTVLPWLILGFLAVLLLRALLSSPRLPLAPIPLALPTAQVQTATPSIAAVGGASSLRVIAPTHTSVPPIPTLAVGFTPELRDQTLAVDTPYTLLGPVVWVRDEAICFIVVPYDDAVGQLQQSHVWARCADLGLAPLPPPSSAPPPLLLVPPAANAPAAPTPAPTPSAPSPPATPQASLLAGPQFYDCTAMGGGGRCTVVSIPTLATLPDAHREEQ